jgi:N-acetylmuramoyl-L-alanine amidase
MVSTPLRDVHLSRRAEALARADLPPPYPSIPMRRLTIGAAAGLVLASCAPAPIAAPSPTVPTPTPEAPRLPSVPARIGPLAIDVVYPAEDAAITAADRTFIFGSVGSGDARLEINGHPVEVAANGAWLAFLPVPEGGVYRLVATRGDERVESTRTVRVPARARAELPAGRVGIVPGSLRPRGVFTRRSGEPLEVRVLGTPGARARVVLPDGTGFPLLERPAVGREAGFMIDRAEVEAGVSEYVGSGPLRAPVVARDTAIGEPGLVERPLGYVERREADAPRHAVVELALGADTVRVPLEATIALLDAEISRTGVVATQRPDGIAVGRRLPVGANNPFQYFFPNGTRLDIIGEQDGNYLVRLTEDLTTWMSAADVELLPAGTPAVSGEIVTVGLEPHPEEVRLRLGTTERVPFRVDPGERDITITFFGISDRTSYVFYGPEDPFVRLVEWEQPADDVYRVRLELTRPLWGYQFAWDEGTNLIVRVRRPPPVDPRSPLRGIRVAVDAGHPPGGAIGPTRLTEAEANLTVVRRLVPMLQRAGAHVLEIRPDTATVPLIQRPIAALEFDAHLFVSVHFNAFGDGVNPFENHGTMMFYYWPHSLEFARHLQREVLAELGLPDRGVRFQNLAITRTWWMPSVLTESMFMMFPEQEAALRDPGVQERIARAHFRAIEAFMRTHAR